MIALLLGAYWTNGVSLGCSIGYEQGLIEGFQEGAEWQFQQELEEVKL